jgi:coatomer protein complex subunit epsilon
MDPFSSEVELIDLHDHFAAGRWQEVVDYDTTSLSEENKVPAHILALRAKVALGEARDVLAELKDAPSGPEYKAIKAYAEHASGKTADALKVAEELATSSADNATVQVLAGSILQNEEKSEEALALLSKHQGNCG